MNANNRTMYRLAATLLAVAVLAGGLGMAPKAVFAATPSAANAPAFYYYADGQRVALGVSTRWAAVKFADSDAGQQAEALKASAAPLDAAGKRRPLADTGLNLVPVKPGASEQALVQGLSSMRHDTRRFENASPVFLSGDSQMIVTDEFIASFSKGMTRTQINQVNARHGVRLMSELLGQPNTFILKIAPNSDLDALEMSNLYQEQGEALSAAPNFVILMPPDPANAPRPEGAYGPAFAPNDTMFNDQWSLNNTQQYGSWMTTDNDIDASAAWDSEMGDPAIVIAVIDEGVELTHEDLNVGSKLTTGYDATGGTTAGGPCAAPCGTYDDMHGTAVAGIAAAATNNSLGVAGVCPLCRIMPVRVARGDGSGGWITTSAILANGITWAYQNGAAVLNLSWTGPSATVITNAINAAGTLGRGGKGAVVVGAAGNSGASTVDYPASLSSVIAVGALNMCAVRKTATNDNCNGYEDWWAGSYGSALDLSAPGVWLDSTDRMGIYGINDGSYGVNANYTDTFNGTSGAAPIVSGVAGLALSANPYLTAAQVQTILLNTANDVGAAGFDTQTGYGRVNAQGAVNAALAMLPATMVDIGTSFHDGVAMMPGSSLGTSYPALMDGPVKISNSVNVLPSERGWYGGYSTFNEIMGFPDNQLTNHYWFPWYDNKSMSTWILIGNPSSTPGDIATVTVKIAGDLVGTYEIGPMQKVTPMYANVMDGPVEVSSDLNIFTSERGLYGPATSFNETLGYPDNQLTSHYWFPWYDNKSMHTWILVGNPSTTVGDIATVTIKVAGNEVGTYKIDPSSNVTPMFADLQDGPVEISSDKPVFTSERSLYGPYNTFNETMGYPHGQLAKHYWFPWYDNVNMSTWVLIGNPSIVDGEIAHVTVKIGGNVVGTYNIDPKSNVTPMFFGKATGPVEIISDRNVFASERSLSGPAQSFNEVMAFPDGQLTTDYWFTWYDNSSMSTQLVIARP